MAELNSYELSMTGQEADRGIRVGMQLGALNGIPYSNGNNEISEARPGTDYGYPLLQGNGPPTANTAANFGQHYYDLSATEPPYEYICVAFTESGGFVWKSHDDAAMHAAIYNAYVTATAFGEIAEIDDGADNIPVKSLVVDIDPAQSGSGEPSPTNVRPISGWTGAKITKTGKNLLPAVVKTTSNNGLTYDRRADGSVRVYGTTNQGLKSYGYLDVPNSNIKGGFSYVIGGCPANGSQTTYCIGVQWMLNGALGFGPNEWGQGLSTPFVIPEGATNVQIFIRVYENITLDLIFKPTIQLADNSSAGFESCTEDTYNISFPAEAGIVYGGTLDVTSGVLTVDKAYYQFNGTETPASMAEFTTVKRATFRLSALGLPDAMAMAGVSNAEKTGLFSHGKYLTVWSGTSADVPHGYADVTNLHIYLPFENATSDSVKACFSSQAENGTPVQIVYSLATPISYQLTPIVIKTLLGINNFWADTGDVNVSYRADPTLIYNKLTAAIISSGGI